MDDLRILRRRMADQIDSLNVLTDAPAVGVSVVVKTIQITTYPTVANNYYAVQLTPPSGVEGEGLAVSYGTATSTFFALNLGGSVPPLGHHLVATYVGRWVFEYGT